MKENRICRIEGENHTDPAAPEKDHTATLKVKENHIAGASKSKENRTDAAAPEKDHTYRRTEGESCILPH